MCRAELQIMLCTSMWEATGAVMWSAIFDGKVFCSFPCADLMHATSSQAGRIALPPANLFSVAHERTRL